MTESGTYSGATRARIGDPSRPRPSSRSVPGPGPGHTEIPPDSTPRAGITGPEDVTVPGTGRPAKSFA